MTARPLRPHQVRALDKLREALLSGARAVMFEAPTGFGKTRVMAEIVLRARARGKRLLLIVPALSLIDQTITALEGEGVTHIGVIQADHPRTDPSAPVQVASAATLRRRGVPEVDLVMIDEAHEHFEFFGPMIADAKAAKRIVIGLSATPWSKGLGKHYDALVNVTSTAELIRDSFLSPFRVFAPSHPDLKSVGTVAGDFNEGQLANAMNKPELVADIVAEWLKRGERRPTFAFAVDRAHAREIQAQFHAASVRAEYIDGDTPRDRREEVRRRFHDGRAEVVVSVGTMTKGVDWDVRCIILARPTKSEILFVQIVGRGLRTAPGKTDCIILDHSSTHQRLGMVTGIRHDKLDDGEPRPAKRTAPRLLPRECPECQAVFPTSLATCPSCGCEAGSAVETDAAGELVQFNENAALAALMRRRRRAAVYGGLKALAAEKGYAAGWAYHKFVERMGDKPDDVRDAEPVPPAIELRRWAKSRAIAYAKARKSA